MNVIYANPNSLEFENQLNQIIQMTKKMAHEIKYVMPIIYREQASKKKLLILLSGNIVVGFCNFNIRIKDSVGVIYEIATHPIIRGKGGAKLLIAEILKNTSVIQLKCPITNKSNGFYDKIGKKVSVEQGKKRPLNVWQITNDTLGAKNE